MYMLLSKCVTPENTSYYIPLCHRSNALLKRAELKMINVEQTVNAHNGGYAQNDCNFITGLVADKL